jgi:hypothetical protein
MSATACTITADTDISWNGTSVKMECTGGGTSHSFNKAYNPSFDVDDDNTNRHNVYVYIPRGELTKLDDTGDYALGVQWIGPNIGHQYIYWFQVGQLTEGWNRLIMDLSTAPSGLVGTIVGNFDPTQVTGIGWHVEAKTAGNNPTVYWDNMVQLDQGAPTVADGTSYTLKHGFEAVGNWVDSPLDTTAANATHTTEGTNALQLTKVSTNTTEMYMYLDTDQNWDLSDDVNGSPSVDVYIPTPGELEAVGAIKVRLGSAGVANFYSTPTAYDEWVFDRDDLAAGWNRLYLPSASPTNQMGGGVADYTDVDRMAFIYTYIDESAYTSGIWHDWFRTIDVGGTLSGNYSYKVTYTTRYGIESNAGPASDTISFSSEGGAVTLAEIPVSSDPQVIQRNIYRTAGGGTEWLYLVSLYDNTEVGYTDNVSDGGLTSTVTPPETGDSSNDHSPPQRDVGMMAVWKRTVFAAGSPQLPDYLFYSNDDEPEQWPTVNFFRLDSRITGMTKTYQGLTVTTENGFWRVTGDNPNFFVEHIIDGMGCVGPRALGTARNEAYALDRDGLRLFNLMKTVKLSEAIRDKYEALDKTNIEDFFIAHSTRNNSILQFNLDASGAMTSEIWMYTYMEDNVQQGVWSTIEPAAGANLDFRDACEIEDSDGERRIYAAADDGMLYELFNEDSLNWVDADGTVYAIESELETNWMRLGQTAGEAIDEASVSSARVESGLVKPVWVELLISGASLLVGSEWTVVVETAPGCDEIYTSLGSDTLTFNFASTESLVRMATQNLPGWDFIKFTITNSEENRDLILRGFRAGLQTFAAPIAYPK